MEEDLCKFSPAQERRDLECWYCWLHFNPDEVCIFINMKQSNKNGDVGKSDGSFSDNWQWSESPSSSLKLFIFRLHMMEEPQSFRLSSSEFPITVQDTMRDVYRCGFFYSIMTSMDINIQNIWRRLLPSLGSLRSLMLSVKRHLNMVSMQLNNR